MLLIFVAEAVLCCVLHIMPFTLCFLREVRMPLSAHGALSRLFVDPPKNGEMSSSL
jgi:hypothetical protein